METIRIIQSFKLLDSGLYVGNNRSLHLGNNIGLSVPNSRGMNEAVSNATNESADFSEVEFNSGYGQVTSAGAIVQKGVTGTLKISLKITSFSESSYKKVTDSITNTVSEEVKSKLKETYSKQNYGNWWLTIFGCGSGQHSDYYKETDSSKINITDTAIKKSLEENMNNSSQEFSVEGEFNITGVSMVPTTVQLFIKTLQITISGSKSSGARTTTVLDNQIAAADEKGNVIPSSGKIKILPLV